MKRVILSFTFLLSVLCSFAQNPREEIRQDPYRAGSNQYVYPAPIWKLSPAPKGKSPFYLSHYGRNGSRFLVDSAGYMKPLEIFRKAESKNLLTEKGKKVMQKLEMMRAESANREGDLTLLGAQQHRDIARRMYEQFPEIFADSVVVDAKSSIVRRCILSMANELSELSALNPTLDIRSDASKHDMYYTCFVDTVLWARHSNDSITSFLSDWYDKNIHSERVLGLLFKPEFMSEIGDKKDLYVGLFSLATIVQDSEIRHSLSLLDIFTNEELYSLWVWSNMWWFSCFGRNVLNGGKQPYTQRNLLRNIIAETDSCLRLDRPGATLRFGHDTMLLSLTCLMDINGYGELMHPSEILGSNWVNYHICPMAGNLQLIFYRSDPNDEDVWVKVLLNEEEASLPLMTVQGMYYRWADVREYYLAVLAGYKEN